MPVLYTTVRQYGTHTFEDRKSVFIGEATPLTTEEEAQAFLESVRKKYPDAKHHVYAYSLRDRGITRFSDDREPSGTAGMPVLDILRKRGIVDCMIVVTRYFGGTLLGTGGLVHAYTEAASGAVNDAIPAAVRSYRVITLRLSYNDYQRFPNLASAHDFAVDTSDFAAEVTVRGRLPEENESRFLSALTDLTGGRAQIAGNEDYSGF